MSDFHELPSRLNEDTKRRLREIAEDEGNEESSTNNTPWKVTVEMCNLMNDMREDGVQPKDIMEIAPFSSQDTLYRHLRGDCTHKARQRVSYDECGWMRFYAKRGAPSKTLAVLYDIDRKTVVNHLSGKCSHNSGLEHLDTYEMHMNGRKDVKMVTSTCPECGEEFEHKEFKDRTFCSESCNGKYAGRKAHV